MRCYYSVVKTPYVQNNAQTYVLTRKRLEKVDKAMNGEKKGITRVPRRKLVEILNWTIFLDSNIIK